MMKKINLSEWDYNKNSDQLESYSAGSNKKVWWICKNNHSWFARISHRTDGSGCPYCSGRLATKENNLKNSKLFLEFSNKNEEDPEKICLNSGKKFWWICEKNHSWKATAASRNRGSGCPYCSGQKVLKEKSLINNIELCKEWDYEKNVSRPDEVSQSSNKKVWWRCKNNHSWKAYINNRNAGAKCPYCSGKLATKENNVAVLFPFLTEETNINLEIFTAGSNKKIWWNCKNGHRWQATIYSRTATKSGCPYCLGHLPTKDNNLKINRPDLMVEWDYEKNKINPTEAMSNSNKKVWWRCKNNHSWTAQISNRSNGSGCPYCSKSISKLSAIWLDELKIKRREILIRTKNKRFVVDGLSDQTVYEFLGDFWHGNPNSFNPNEINPKTKTTYLELLKKTIEKFNILVENGYRIIYKWESDINKEFKYLDIDLKIALKINKIKQNIDILQMEEIDAFL